MAGNISTFCSPFLTLWIKLVVFQVVLLLHGTGYAANTVANYTANPSELPVLPENLPAPADMPILINNRFVDADKTYEIWPKEKKMPRFLWVAVKDEKEDLPPHITALMKRNDGWMPQVCDNDCKQAFLNKYWAGTSVLWAYNNISWGSSKANIWRYAVLYTYGGMYIDDDSDFTTNFDDIIRPEDSLLLSQEGVPDFKPCYESYYHLSDSAFYKRYEKLLNNPDYDKEHVYFQGLQALDFEITPDITTDERNAANALSSYLIVPVQKNKVQTPVFFHGSTLLNWAMFAAPRHPFYARTLTNLVDIIGSQYIRHSTGYVHMRKFDKPHKLMLCSTNFVMTYSLREMLADGSFATNMSSEDDAGLVVNDSLDKPRISVRDFNEYGGKCKAGATIEYSWQKFNTRAKKHPRYLTHYSHDKEQGKTSIRKKLEGLNNNAVMLSDGKDRGVYYISNASSTSIIRPIADDEDAIKSFSKHRFEDMDTLYSYGYSLPEVVQVQQAVIDHVKEGVPVISKEMLRKKLGNSPRTS